MPAKKYRVKLDEQERTDLMGLVNKGQGAARRITRGRILLLTDETQENGGLKDEMVAEVLGVSTRTVERIRQKCVEQGIEVALNHTKPSRTRAKVLDGAAEATLTQIACTQAPEGRTKWTLHLLKDKLIEQEIVEQVSHETVRTTLKKMNLSLG